MAEIQSAEGASPSDVDVQFTTAVATLSEAFTSSEQASILATFGHGPEGEIIKGRLGYTHFVLEEPTGKAKKPREVVMMSHGLGTSTRVFLEVRDAGRLFVGGGGGGEETKLAEHISTALVPCRVLRFACFRESRVRPSVRPFFCELDPRSLLLLLL